jgi:2-methylcitrate dehydratase PrpD
VDPARATRGLGSEWETLQVAVKPFPACHFVHAFADAAIALHRSGVRAEEVDALTALVPAEIVKTVCEPAAAKQRPANDYDARFSIPYVVAASLRAGKFGLAELDPEALQDPATLSLASKVRYELDPRSTFPRHYCGEVVVRLRNGKEARHREGMNRGCADRPLTNADVVEKFEDNARYAISSRRTEEMKQALVRLDEHPARALEDALAAG